jgi:hypothetical protein
VRQRNGRKIERKDKIQKTINREEIEKKNDRGETNDSSILPRDFLEEAIFLNSPSVY